MSSRATQRALFLLAGFSIYQSLTIISLSRRLRRGRQQFEKLHGVTNYFLEIINENDIELTEFDVIALNTITEEK
jgi:hypothetical protein